MKKILALLACLLATPVAAQTTLPWGQAVSAEPRAVQMRNSDGTWLTIGNLNNTTHIFGLLLTAMATENANTVVANFTGSSAKPVAFAMPTCASPSFIDYTAGTGFICSAITANGVTLGNIAQIGANTVLANVTGSTANVAAFAMPSCVGTNFLQYTSGTGFTCAAGGGTGTVTSVAVTGGLATQSSPITTSGSVWLTQAVSNYRLTLTSGTPVMTASVAAATSIIITPYNGQLINTFAGASAVWAATNCGELSNVLANSSTGNAGPAAVVAGGVYDLFVWNNGNLGATNCFLTRGPAWTNPNTRSAGTALARTNGFLTNNVTITNGPAANQGLYVGSFVADSGSGTVSYQFGGAASGGVQGNMNVWNMYNRVNMVGQTVDSGAGYAYNTASVREARASTGNQINILLGLQEDMPLFTLYAGEVTPATLATVMEVGIGVDSSSVFAGAVQICETVAAQAINCLMTSSTTPSTAPALLSIGTHFISSAELGSANAGGTFDGFGGTNSVSNALTVTIRE